MGAEPELLTAMTRAKLSIGVEAGLAVPVEQQVARAVHILARKQPRVRWYVVAFEGGDSRLDLVDNVSPTRIFHLLKSGRGPVALSSPQLEEMMIRAQVVSDVTLIVGLPDSVEVRTSREVVNNRHMIFEIRLISDWEIDIPFEYVDEVRAVLVDVPSVETYEATA
jgi:hypothetical protein